MCGIYGFSIPLDAMPAEQRALLAAFLAHKNDDRGGDSWGLYALNGAMTLLRGLGRTIGSAKLAQVVGNAHLLMGHTRKATSGAITIPNAHPFEMGNILGAHNGWINNHKEMNTRHKRDFDVDSMHIFAHIQKGWRLTELEGSGAIEYTNRKKWPERVNLCKLTASGDLAIAGLGSEEATTGVVWSSTEYHLKFALDAAGLDGGYFMFKVETGNIYCAEKGRLTLHKKKYTLSTPNYGTASYNGRSTTYTYPSSYTPRVDTWDGDPDKIPMLRGNGHLDWEVYFYDDVKTYVDKGAILDACYGDTDTDGETPPATEGEKMAAAAQTAALQPPALPPAETAAGPATESAEATCPPS